MRLRRYAPTMMLLMGMWISFTKNPMKPMMAKPIAVAIAIFWNSENKKNKMLIKSICTLTLFNFSGYLRRFPAS